MFRHRCAMLRVAKGDSGSPFKVRNKRRSELWIIRHTGIVRSQAHQRGEAESLIFRYPQIQVLSQHPFVATEVFCVSSGTAEHLGPPRGDVTTVVLVNSAREERREQLILLDSVI